MATSKFTPAKPAEIALRLQYIRATVVTAANALRAQNVEADADVALALQRGVSDPLSEIVEPLDSLSGKAIS